MIGVIWVLMIVASLAFAAFNGSLYALPEALADGAAESVKFIISIGGMILFWSGILEIMKRSGLSEKIARFFSPFLCRMFPSARGSDVLSDISANVTANLLGLGNAATPAGIRAAEGLYRLGKKRYATKELCLLVVINTASLQLIPTTVAAIRSGFGAENAFDILPAVWAASFVSQFCGICAVLLFSRLWRKRI